MSTTDTARLIEALDDTGHWWLVGKGQSRPGEPLFGCLIQEAQIDGKTLAKAEGNSIDFCMIEALERLRNAGH